MSPVFISYSRKDKDFARRLVQALESNQFDTWIDWHDIPKGEDWEQEIYRGIEAAEAFLFLISPDSVKSEMCNREIAHAVRNGKRILPLFIAPVEDNQIYTVTGQFLYKEQKEEINRRNFILCREGKDDFDRAVLEIDKTIRTDFEWLKFHTRLQGKALEWEPQNDHSRLLRGRELREAEQQLAGAGSTKDPQPTELQHKFIAASRRDDKRRTSRSRLLVIALTFTLFLVCGAGYILLDRTPAKVEVTGQTFEIRNRSGFRFLKEDVGSTISSYKEPVRLTPDGKYLFILGTGADGTRPGTILVYDMKGNIDWEYQVTSDPYGGPPGNFKIRQLIVDEVLGNGESQIIFTAQKSDWFPTELVMLNAEGNPLGYYWNPGFIYDILRQDFDGDGIKELVVSAVNNNLGVLTVNDDTKHPVTVYVLSPEGDFTGQAFPDLIRNLPAGTEYNHWVAVFEPHIVGGIQLRITEESGEELIEVVFNPQGGYLWLDARGRIRKAGLSDYWRSLEGDKSPADYICFLQSDNDKWYFQAQVDQKGVCPWYAGR